MLGFIFYALQLPEKRWPGRFDLVAHSHQIWHVLVFTGAYLFYLAVLVSPIPPSPRPPHPLLLFPNLRASWWQAVCQPSILWACACFAAWSSCCTLRRVCAQGGSVVSCLLAAVPLVLR